MVLSEKVRENEILNYVNLNQGCLKEEAFSALNGKMSRNTFFKDITRLIKEKQIRLEYSNKRDHRLYPYTMLITQIQDELDKFSQDLQRMLDKGQEYLEEAAEALDSAVTELPNTIILRIISPVLRIFIEVVSLYNYYALFVWPNQIKDPEVLTNLNHVVFVMTNELRKKIVERYQSLLPYDTDNFAPFIPSVLISTLRHDLDYLTKHFKVYSMDKEYMPIKNFLRKLSNALSAQE
jgi:hypothetical protein